MARTRIYIKPFDPDGTYATDYVEVTDDVVGNPTSIKQEVEGSDFDVGILKNSSFSLRLSNFEGRYDEAGGLNSIFSYKRSDSLVKVTWDIADQDFNLGTSSLEDYLDEEVSVFIGLLSDDSAATNLPDSEVTFKVLGREAILDRALAPTPYGVTPTIDAESVIFATLSQTRITDLLTVTLGNINVGNNIEFVSNAVLDAALEGKTAKAALEELLLLSNSVLYIDGDDVIVAPRTAGATVQKTFYGQTATGAVENVQGISDIRSGQGRLFNYVTWRSSPGDYSENVTTVAKYGYFRKELDSDLVSVSATLSSIATALVAEFGDLKKEFTLSTPLDYDVIALKVLDRVALEYPALIVSTTEEAVYGDADYGVDFYPAVNEAFSWLLADELKIIGKEVDLANQLVKLKLRKI